MVGLHQRGRTWWVSYQQAGRQVRRSLNTTNRKVAQDAWLDLQVQLRDGSPPPAPAKPERVPVGVLRDDYRAYCLAHKAARTARSDLNRLKEFFDRVRVGYVDEITTAVVSQFLSVKVLEDGIAPATVRRYREILHALMEHARRLDLVTENAVSRIPSPRLPEREPRFLSLDQIDEVLRKTDCQLRAVVATAIWSGLRREELCWLTWSDVDLGGVPVLRVRGKEADGQAWMPKTKRSRAVPVSPKLREVLAELPRRTRWVFPSPAGKRWDPDNLSARLRETMHAAGLPWTFLDFRHTFGSQLAQRGTSLVKIAKLLGNSPTVCHRHYITLVPEELAADVAF